MKLEPTDATPVFVIREARTPGAWGKGRTFAAAATSIRKHGAANGSVVYTFVASDDACFNEMGDGVYRDRGPIYKGTLHNTGVKITEVYDEQPLKNPDDNN